MVATSLERKRVAGSGWQNEKIVKVDCCIFQRCFAGSTKAGFLENRFAAKYVNK